MKEGNAETPETGSPENKFAEYLKGSEWQLPTDVGVVEAAEVEVEKRLREAGWNEDDASSISLGVHEALINAIAHGNLKIPNAGEGTDIGTLALQKQKEAPTEKRVYVTLDVKPEEVAITVRDEGEGFDWKQVPDPTNTEALLKPAGRGIFLLRYCFDSVEYNKKGNEVTLIKRIPKQGGS